MVIEIEDFDGVRAIKFQRPEVLNAFNDELGLAVVRAVEEASADAAVRCIVLTGSGRGFSSGEDLAALADIYASGEAPTLSDPLTTRYNPLVRAITGAPKPVVAAVNGVAAGAGASVAFACDFRVAVDSAKFVLAFVKVGLIPDAGGLWFLSRMIGSARAWRLAASGAPLSASEAFELGILDASVPADEFEPHWRELAVSLAKGPTKAFAEMKKLLYSAATATIDEQLDIEVGAQAASGSTQDHLEGVQAFLMKRAPNFEGR